MAEIPAFVEHVDVRADIVKWGNWAVAHKPWFIYSEARPYHLFTPSFKRFLPCDCGITCTWCYWEAGAPDPSEDDYDGEGNTSTLQRGTQIPLTDVLPGDIVIYGPGYGVHCALIIEAGPDPLTMSHGWSGEPAFVRVSVGQPSGTDGVVRYFRYVTTKPVEVPAQRVVEGMTWSPAVPSTNGDWLVNGKEKAGFPTPTQLAQAKALHVPEKALTGPELVALQSVLWGSL